MYAWSWMWQPVPDGQWWMIRSHDSADPGRLPSAGSVALPAYLITSPTLNVVLDTGARMCGTGPVAPTPIGIVAVSLAPLESVTLTCAVYWPSRAYVWVAVTPAAVAPSPKSQA